MVGRLYLIPTPIGNAGDITQRALEVLRELPVLACEDTRTARRLLKEHNLPFPRLLSYTEHNRTGRIGQIIEALATSDVGLVSEAGMPGISDPGQELVVAVLAAGFDVVALPGPTAPIAALAASGLSTRRFLFLGFLPRTAGHRRAALREVKDVDATLIIFESPRRVRATLADVRESLGDRRVVAAREVTKVHEEFIRGTTSEVIEKLDNPLGEFTLLVEGQTEKPAPDEVAAAITARNLAADGGISTRDLAGRLREQYGLSRRRSYELAAEARDQG